MAGLLVGEASLGGGVKVDVRAPLPVPVQLIKSLVYVRRPYSLQRRLAVVKRLGDPFALQTTY